MSQPGVSSPASHQSAYRAHQLIRQRLRAPLAMTVDHTVAGVAVQQTEGDLVERRLNGGDLGDHIDAVAIVFDHSLDASHLTFDPLQAVEELVFRSAVAARFRSRHLNLHEPSWYKRINTLRGYANLAQIYPPTVSGEDMPAVSETRTFRVPDMSCTQAGHESEA